MLEWEWIHTARTPARRAPAEIGAHVTQDQALPNPRDGVMLSIPRQGHPMARHYLYATLIAGAQVAEQNSCITLQRIFRRGRRTMVIALTRLAT